MEKGIDFLHAIIEKFIKDQVNAKVFEQEFTDFFDFFDFPDSEVSYNYFANIREVLEHYSPYEGDIKKYPKYYISDAQLKEKVIELTDLYQLQNNNI